MLQIYLDGVLDSMYLLRRLISPARVVQETVGRISMNYKKTLTWIFATALAGAGLSGTAQAQERFITIGTGGQTGVYYVAGQSICRFVNRNAENIRCNAPASGGGVANVNGLRSGEFNLGIKIGRASCRERVEGSEE